MKTKKKDLLRRIEEIEARLVLVEQRQNVLITPISWNTPTTTPPDCGCPTSGYVCNNYACPRAPRITSAAGNVAGSGPISARLEGRQHPSNPNWSPK